MDPSHVIAYDFDHEIAAFVRDHSTVSLTYGQGGTLHYDFVAIEQFIVDRYFAGKPKITLEIPMFEFLDERRSASGLQSLRQKLAQVDLPSDVCDRIRTELGTTDSARLARRIVETVISFVQATGGTLVQKLDVQAGEQLLYDYVRDVLLVRRVQLWFSLVVLTCVCLVL